MTLDNHFARYIKNNTGETKPTQSQAVKTFEIPGTTGPLSTRDILNILDKGLPQDFNKKDSRITEDFGATSSLTAKPLSPEPQMIINQSFSVPVKTAPIDTILFNDESISIEEMSDFIFEDIGGQELINIARSDTINGQKILHQPIKNLSSIQQRYNPNNILSIQQTSDKYFAGFSIKLEDKIPNEGNGPSGENVYIDINTGDIIIELINLNPDEQVETQITVNGTIYEADFGDYIS
jgi:hypothetical protein